MDERLYPLFHHLREKILDNDDPVGAERVFWTIARIIWEPDEFYWNPWSGWIVSKCLDPKIRKMTLMGAKQCSKSTTVMMYALVVWWACQGECSVLYRTTSVNDASLRGWGEFIRLLKAAKVRHPDLPGHYMRAKPPLLKESEDSDDLKHIISCKPIGGESADSSRSAYASIKGIHTRVQILIDDEMNELPLGTHTHGDALEGSFKNFIHIGIGNPTTWTDSLGLMATPTEMSIQAIYDNDLDEWAIKDGVGLRFNAWRSPNLLEPDATDEKGRLVPVYPHLPTEETIRMLVDSCGGEDHPSVWQFARALPAPEGVKQTVLTRSMVRQYEGDGEAVFKGTPQLGAAMDGAFTAGGDDCVIQFFRFGHDINDKWMVELLGHEVIKIKLSDEKHAHFHVAEEAFKLCKAKGVPPGNFGFDRTGPGMALRGIFARVWAGNTKETWFGGGPTYEKVSVDDSRRGRECFDKKVTEMCFNFRQFVEAGQVRGLFGENDQIVAEACLREYSIMSNGKLSVKPKAIQTNKKWSMDRLDAALIVFDVLRQLGYMPGWGEMTAEQKAAADRKKAKEAANLLNEKYGGESSPQKESWGDKKNDPDRWG